MLCIFIIDFVCRDFAYARVYLQKEELLRQKKIYMELPVEYGQIEETYENGQSAGRPVILIHDMHANPGVQKNIMNQILRNYGL